MIVGGLKLLAGVLLLFAAAHTSLPNAARIALCAAGGILVGLWICS